MASEYGRPNADSIRQCYYLISKAENHPKPLEFASPPPRCTTGLTSRPTII